MDATHTHCLRCGRLLRSVVSRARGYGRTCAARVRRAAADLAGFKPHQVDAARELIEDGAIVAIRNQVFRAVSTDGTATYLCHPTNCACPAGLASRRCYHVLAARLLLAA
ncbi:DUF6011 domain-containing protein [Streptomyces sp. NPDC006784]|uniref:DUF6011 domain-containing protein n=1 Tax=Streptomyces sp. NPDC006784 TaxID=3364764 RepID=UPI0036918B09